jgi:hypothetical protein
MPVRGSRSSRLGWQRRDIGRQELLVALGGAAAAWPLAARAQQTDRLRRIGLLMNRAADNPEGRDRISAFHQGLQELGWSVGRNVRIDARWGEDDVDHERKYATELVAASRGSPPHCDREAQFGGYAMPTDKPVGSSWFSMVVGVASIPAATVLWTSGGA